MSARSFRQALLAIAVVGLVLRVIYAYALVKSRPLVGDALEFQQMANLLAGGHGLIQPVAWYADHVARATADKPPVYPLLEAVVSWLGGRTWAWHDIVDLLAGTGTIIVVGVICRRVVSARAGLIAAGLAAAYPLLIAADGSLRSEPVFALTVTLALLAAIKLREAPSARRAAVLGVAIAVAALTRGEALLLIVLLPFGLAGLWRGAVTVVACLIVLSPWLVRDWVAFGRPVLISTNVGGLMAGANCASTYSRTLIGQWSLLCLPRSRYRNEAQESSRLLGVGLRYAEHHADRLPAVVAARVGRSFELFRPEQDWNIETFFEGRDKRVEEAGVYVYYVVALLAIGGALVLGRRGGPWGILLSPVVLVLFISITAYGFTRFRVVAEPGLIVLAAVALDALLARLRFRKRPAFTERRDGPVARSGVAGAVGAPP